jgi:hypothetical protein
MTAPAACDHEGARDARGFAASGHGLRGYAFTVGGVEVMLMPSEARAQGVPLRTLNAEQAATLDALGETLVPGAKQAGITNFVDQQISGPAEEALLEARPAPCRVGLVRSSARMDRLGAARRSMKSAIRQSLHSAGGGSSGPATIQGALCSPHRNRERALTPVRLGYVHAP